MIKEEYSTRTKNNGASNSPASQIEHLEAVHSWGGATSSVSYVYRPVTKEQLFEIFDLARISGRTVGLRGGGKVMVMRQ